MGDRAWRPPLPPAAARYLYELRARTLEEPGALGPRRALAGWRDLLLDAGWPARSIAESEGVTRQAVHQWGANVGADTTGHPLPPMPPPPPPLPPPPPKPVLPAPSEADTARMRELGLRARHVNGGTPAGHPDRAASAELTDLMVRLIDAGIPVNRVARHAGVTRNAVYTRIARRYPERVPGYVRETMTGEPARAARQERRRRARVPAGP